MIEIDGYITLVSVPGSLLRSTKEGKLRNVIGREGSQLIPESFGTSLRIF